MPAQNIETGHEDTVHDVAIVGYSTASSDTTIKIIGITTSVCSGHKGPVWEAHIFNEHKSSMNLASAWSVDLPIGISGSSPLPLMVTGIPPGKTELSPLE
ncbi:hypothetical protein Gotur_024430 [Gossypium turneri]